MPKIGATIDWGLELVDRRDLFSEVTGETLPDGILHFGKHKGEYLSETNRHWLCWLFVIKMDTWPQHLLDRVEEVGRRLSAGKAESWDELAADMLFQLEEQDGDY